MAQAWEHNEPTDSKTDHSHICMGECWCCLCKGLVVCFSLWIAWNLVTSADGQNRVSIYVCCKHNMRFYTHKQTPR